MAGTSNAEADLDSLHVGTFSAFTQDESSNGSSDDTFLAIQRATSTVGKIYKDFLPCRELISFLVCQNAVTAMNFVT